MLGLKMIVSVGRVKWIPDSPFTGKDTRSGACSAPRAANRSASSAGFRICRSGARPSASPAAAPESRAQRTGKPALIAGAGELVAKGAGTFVVLQTANGYVGYAAVPTVRMVGLTPEQLDKLGYTAPTPAAEFRQAADAMLNAAATIEKAVLLKLEAWHKLNNGARERHEKFSELNQRIAAARGEGRQARNRR
jgi:hypothetical protein